MADSRSEIAERYASALFELAKEEGRADTVEADLDSLKAAYGESDDFRRLVQSPALSSEQKQAGIAAILEGGKADTLTQNFGRLLARNGRLGVLPQVITTFKRIAAEDRGEVAAEVVSAHPLTEDQLTELKTQIRASIGKDVTLDTRTDPDLLGGLIVKIGSRMIDSSLKTKLARMRARLKEA
jgi:F-type H+-transporting ATPase subunit delta